MYSDVTTPRLIKENQKLKNLIRIVNPLIEEEFNLANNGLNDNNHRFVLIKQWLKEAEGLK